MTSNVTFSSETLYCYNICIARPLKLKWPPPYFSAFYFHYSLLVSVFWNDECLLLSSLFLQFLRLFLLLLLCYCSYYYCLGFVGRQLGCSDMALTPKPRQSCGVGIPCIWDFPQIRGTFWEGARRIRIIIFWWLYWGPLILGKLPYVEPKT